MNDRAPTPDDVPSPPLARETPAPPGYVPPLEGSAVLADLGAQEDRPPARGDEPDEDASAPTPS